MIYVCGTDRNYDDWAGITGDRSWNYEHMLPLIKKNQNMQDPRLTTGKCAAFHGTTGPLVVTTSDYDANFDSLAPTLRAAIKEKGLKELTEINCGPPYIGFVHAQSTVNNGERESAARAFLVPIRDQPNFYFMQNSFVDKIYLRKHYANLLVDGVSVLTKQDSCQKIKLQAQREVIISAGAYGSPQILLRSGVGRRKDLRRCNINQLKNLPVGRNLADHFITVHFFTFPGNETSTKAGALAFFEEQGVKFNQDQSGFLTTGSFNHHWFVNTRESSSPYPDVQFLFGVFDQNLIDFEPFIRDKVGFKDEFADQLINANKDHSLVMVASTLLQPKSRGSVKLRDCDDPYSPPVINPKYLRNQNDRETSLRAIRMLNDLMNTDAAKKGGIAPLDLVISECDVFERGSDRYNNCFIKYFSQNLWHPSGTCRMGFSEWDNVVDSKLRVFGVKKTFNTPMLRVADASIMPMITSGNTQCPVYAIGEKAAETIIAENL
jgi:choline dehydrogenase